MKNIFLATFSIFTLVASFAKADSPAPHLMVSAILQDAGINSSTENIELVGSEAMPTGNWQLFELSFRTPGGRFECTYAQKPTIEIRHGQFLVTASVTNCKNSQGEDVELDIRNPAYLINGNNLFYKVFSNNNSRVRSLTQEQAQSELANHIHEEDIRMPSQRKSEAPKIH